MKNIFDPEDFKLNAVVETQCWGCRARWAEFIPPPEFRSPPSPFRKEPKEETGPICPPGKHLFVNVKKDYQCLGLETRYLPQSLNLCLECLPKYMNQFNALLTKKQQREKLAGSKTKDTQVEP